MELTSKHDTVAEGKLLNLGAFGKIEESAVPDAGNWPEIPRFPWFGVSIRVNPAISDAALIDLIEEHGELDLTNKEDAVKAAIAVKVFVRSVVHPQDFDDFWKLGKEHGYTMEQFAEVAGMIVQEITADPTEESNDSSPGPSATVTKSTADGYKATIEELESEGRPDLAEFFDLARAHGVAT